MTPDAPASPDPAAGRPTVRIRKKRRTHGRRRLLRDLWVPSAIVIVLLAILAVRYISHLAPASPVIGYIGNPESLQQEYLDFEGKPLANASVAQQFQHAGDLAAKGDYKDAISILEGISKRCAVPAVFYDIGLLYAQMNDHDKAVAAFRETLARDPFYEAVRNSLASLRGFDTHSADPISSESEPNDTCLTANLISRETDVVGEITSTDDVDCFRFSAPRSPRDVLRIEIRSHSTSLAPRLVIYNADQQATGESAESADPGSPLSLLIAPRANTTMYVEVSGSHKTLGAYGLRIIATKSYDRYEPDDDIGSARHIPVDKELEANIMCSDDHDFYSFVADRSGKMPITVETETNGLHPDLDILGPDQLTIPSVPGPGESATKMVRTINVTENQTYYAHVSGRAKSTGNYRLTVGQKTGPGN
jgi:hypothetical protein